MLTLDDELKAARFYAGSWWRLRLVLDAPAEAASEMRRSTAGQGGGGCQMNTALKGVEVKAGGTWDVPERVGIVTWDRLNALVLLGRTEALESHLRAVIAEHDCERALAIEHKDAQHPFSTRLADRRRCWSAEAQRDASNHLNAYERRVLDHWWENAATAAHAAVVPAPLALFEMAS